MNGSISNMRQFLFAFLLPATAITVGLQACNDDGTGLSAEKAESKESTVNPLMRSPEEAIDIAQGHTVIFTEENTQDFLHYNWGWYGHYDGWYNNAVNVIIYKNNGSYSYYRSLKYARIK